MKCPRCVQSIHRTASSCPHCGFGMWHADERYGAEDVSLEKFTDAAGVLRMKERDPMRKVLDRFEAKFPQLFVSVYLGAFDELDNIRQFGFWMLNRADYVDVDRERPNENGILILVDVNSKSASITYGYALLPYLDEETTFAALSAGHPAFLQGDFLEALTTVVHRLEGYLLKGWKRVKKDPDALFADTGQQPTHVSALLQSSGGGDEKEEAKPVKKEITLAEKKEKEVPARSDAKAKEIQEKVKKVGGKASKENALRSEKKASKKGQSNSKSKKVGAKK